METVKHFQEFLFAMTDAKSALDQGESTVAEGEHMVIVLLVHHTPGQKHHGTNIQFVDTADIWKRTCWLGQIMNNGTGHV